MSTQDFHGGPWRLRGERALFEELRDALEEAASAGRRMRTIDRLGPFVAFCKGSALRPRPALRHALRGLAGRELPRLAEFANLSWLRAHGFLAPRPLLAGARRSAGLSRYQFLCTELVPAARTLEEALPGAPPAQRAAWLTALARDVAALHRQGFVHRDLFARNLLVGGADSTRCTFLDAWRGGPGRGLRGPDHDLGCFFLAAATTLTREEQSLFLTTYRGESHRAGRRLPRDWPRRIERARSRLLAREARRHADLAPAWDFPREGV